MPGPARGGRVSVLDPSDDVLDASPPPRMPRTLSSSAAEDDIRCFADALSCLTAPLRLLLAAAACLLSLLSLLLALLWCGLPGLCALRPFRRRAAQRRRGEAACTARGARRAARGAAGQLQGLRRARRQHAARAGGQRRGCAGGGVEPRPSGIAARLLEGFRGEGLGLRAAPNPFRGSERPEADLFRPGGGAASRRPILSSYCLWLLLCGSACLCAAVCVCE